MELSVFYKLIVGISPKIEILFRKIYWKNISITSGLRPHSKRIKNKTVNQIEFDHIIQNLRNRGVKKGSIIIVHSSYDLLESSGLTPEEINGKLLELVGAEGTLVMPIIRKYKEEGKIEEYLTKSMDNIVCTYDVQKSRVVSGFLPFALMQEANSYLSRFPLNPVVAIGKHAAEMVEHNLDGVNPSPHGPNSSWKYCVDNNAIVIGLGVKMPHFLTITHVNEECSQNWPIKDWYRKRKFKIIDRDYTIEKEVLERRPLWGTYYFAEIKFGKDLRRGNLLKSETVEGLDISLINSKQLTEFLHNHPHKGYPYYVKKGYLKTTK